MKASRIFCLLLLAAVLLAGCAPGTNTLVGSQDTHGVVAGFWRGLWHGIISPVTFIISLFTRNVQLYDVHNNGGWYDFGFMLGVSIIFGGSAGGARGRRRRD
jgi:hypothetical protein